MVRTPHDDFVATKNAEANKPVTLYRINISDTPEASGESDLFLANFDADISFFKTDSGVDSPQVYTAFSLQHGSISENTEGQTNSLSITIGNANRFIQSFLELRDGLRGRKVTIRKVWQENLANQSAYTEDIYYIDSATSDSRSNSVQFRLISELDLMNVELPLRRYIRNQCAWTYKGFGCWIDDGAGGFIVPTGFSNEYYWLHRGSIISHTGNPSMAEAHFRAKKIRGLDKATDSLLIDIKCDLPALITAESQIEVCSGGKHDLNEWNYGDLTGLGITPAWQTFTLPFAGWGETGGGVNGTAGIDYIRVYSYSSGADITISWKSARMHVVKPYSWIGGIDSCNKSLAECERHNNVARFGGYPFRMTRKIFNVR